MKNDRHIVIVLALMISVVSYGARFRASAPQTVVIGEPFRVSYTLDEQGGDNLKMPSIQNFDIVAGPYRYSSSRVELINGKASSSSTETYTYTLVAMKKGTFTIPAATINLGSQHLTSNSIRVTVVPEGHSDQTEKKEGNRLEQNGDPQSRSRAASQNITKENVFIRAIPTKTRLYEQDCFMVTYKLYSLIDVVRSNANKIPDFNGFMKQEMEQDRNPQMKLEHYNGKNYGTVVLYQALLYPQHSGTIKIEPCSFDMLFRIRHKNVDRLDIFSNFFDTYSNVQKTISSNPLTIHVDKLPSNKPVNFSGGVGVFNLNSMITKTNVGVNDPITLKITISGTGNLKMVKNPEIEFPADFEQYDPKVTNKLRNGSNGVSGQKVIEFLLIPRSAGKFKIPSYEFSYFDLSSKKYKTVRTPEYTINVAQTSNGQGKVAVANYTEQDQLRILGQDIRYIHTDDPKMVDRGNYLLTSVKYWLTMIIILLIGFAVLILLRRRYKIHSDVTILKTRKANKVATKRLKVAKTYMESGNNAEFYKEVSRALLGYASDKLQIPQAELTKENVANKLRERKCSEETSEQFKEVVEDCELAQYSPMMNEEVAGTYDRAVELISKLQEEVK